MRPAIDYSLDELMEFATLDERTKEAVAKLKEAFAEIVKKEKLNKREAIFALASTVHTFIDKYDGSVIDGRALDAEAAFNDYLLASMDISEGMLLGNLEKAALKGASA